MIYILLCAKYLQQVGAASQLGIVTATRVCRPVQCIQNDLSDNK